MKGVLTLLMLLLLTITFNISAKPILNKRIYEFNSRLNVQEEFKIFENDNVVDKNFHINELRIQLNDGKTYEQIAFYDKVRPQNYSQAVAYNTLDRRWIKFKGKLLYFAGLSNGVGKTDTLKFRVLNPNGEASDWGEIRISLDGRFDQNYDVYPNNDAGTTIVNASKNLNVLANDPNVQSWYGVEIYSSPSHGSVSVNNDKSIKYTPDNNFSGVDTFSYRIKGNNLYDITSAPAQVTVTISQPNQPPVVTYQTPVNGDVYLTNYNIVAKAGANDSDGTISRLEFKLNNGGWFSDTTSPYSHEFGQLSEGQHTFYVRARDNEGAYSDTQAATVTVRQPNKAPTVSAQFPSNGQSFTSAEQITATASANDSDGTVSQVEFKINNGNWFTDTTSPYSHNLGRHPVGNHTLYYRAKDNNNQYSDVATVSITVTEPAKLPTVNANWSPDSIKIGQSSTFSWGSTNSTACILDGQVKPTTGSMSFSNLQSNKSISIYCEGDGGRSQTLTPQVTVSDWPDVAPTLSKNGNTLSWNVIADTKRYELQQANCGGNCNEIVESTWLGIQNNLTTNYTLPNQTADKAYRVRACYTVSQCTAWSNVLTSMIEANGDWSDLTPTAVDDANELAVGNLDSVDLSSVSVEAKPAVSGGQASYHIPIALPPGRAGLQPSIAINYNSQSGNGVMGMGFNLQAAGEISRCGSTYVNDGVNLAVTFDASNDKLCLNGQRLVNTVGIYGEHDTEYRTEMESFVKVVQSNAINDSDSAFTVYYPDGSSATFGHTPNSRFSPDGLNTVLTWKLTQKADPSGNNTIDYRYDTDVAGEHLLSDIYYTGTSSTLGERRVKFIYEDRADKKHGYMQGGVVTTTRRLAKIETYRHGSDESTANWVSRYTLNYTNSVSSNRSLLDTIQRCGKFNGNTQCTLTSQFDWHNKVSTHEWSPLTIKQGNTDVQPYKDYTKALDFKVADVNGDGTLDFPGYMVDAEQSIIGTHNLPTTSIVFDVLTLKPTRLGSIDINLDGLADFITVDGQNIVYRINNGGVMASQLATDIILPNDVDSIIALLDMNGDGYPDVVTRQGDGPRERYHDQDIIVYWNTRNKDNPYRESSKQTLYSLQDFNEFTVESVSFIGDADNNGLPDMAVYGLMEFNMGITDAAPRKILFNNGQDVAMTSYNLPEPDREIIVTDPSRFHFMADINGDGLIDLLYWNKDTNNIELLYRLNLGNRSFSEQKSFGDSVFATRSYARKQGPEEPIEYTFPKYLQAIKVADTNLDGVNELLVPGELLVESCATIMERKGNTRVDTRFCGDELYGQYQDGQPGYNRPIPLSYDKSIYKYHALHFVRNETTGDIGVERRATNLVGTPESVVMDLFGDGLLDLVSAVYQSSEKGASYYPNWDREYLSVDSQGNELEGIYISRNYGAGSGITTADYQPIDYLESVTDGLGNRSQWRYRPLSTGESSADQTKLYSTAFDYHSDGYLHFASSMYVVKSFSQTNGVGGENVRHFAYKGAMFNTEGRGFTGFREIIEKDAQRNIVTSSVFEQKFPQIGLLTNQEVTSNGTVISSLEQIWRDNPEHLITDTEHQFLQHSKLDKWDLDGTQISKKETTVPNDETGIDQYGNIKRQTVTITDYIDGETNSDSVTSIREFDSNTTGTNWWLNKLTSQQTVTSVVTRNWANDPLNTVTDNLDIARTKTVSYTDWDTLHNKPKTITVTASDVTCSIETKVVYNTYGLAISNSVEAKAGSGVGNGCSSQAKRSSSINYTKNGTSQDDAGYFPFKVTNAKNHDTTTHYDVGFGVPVKVEAPNNLESTTTLDAIGRPIQVAASGQPTQYIRYLSSAADSNNPTHGKTMVRTKAMGQSTTTVYLDSVGRELRVVTQGFASEQQIIDKEYDTQGRLLKESLPYASSMSPSFTEYGEFDALDRPNWRKLPHGLESTYSYNGLVTNITVNNERTMSRTYNSRNWLLETVDAKDGANRFSYDALGQVLVIQDAKGAKIKAHYNGFGHKYKVDDPNNGVTEFKYNTFGELTWQKDAEGVEQNINYDALGRVNSRIIRGGHNPHTANYTWDTRKEGLLSTESANGITRNYYYDHLARVNHTQITQAGKVFSIKPQYDANYGRVKGLEYPNGLTIAYQYNDNGYLTHTKNAATGYVYREITEMDWASRTTMANLADGQLELSAAYDAESSVMLSTEVTSHDRLIHGHEYTDFDMYKNLKVERDKVTQLSKSYQYDSLNRLEQYTYSNSQYGFSETVDYAFDATGNLLKKNDYSANSDTAYRYGGDSDCGSHLNVATRSNAVCQVTKADGTTVQFTYDNNGNLLTGDGLDITYNFINKPLIVGRNSAQLTPAISRFYYGSDGARARQERTVNDQLTTTYYADKLYELDSDGAWRAYIDDIAVLSFTPERAHQIRYTLRDRLGSATTLVDHNGEVVSRRYFDPFGRTANIDADPSSFDWETLAADKRGIADFLDSGRNRRGFTDHEHLNEQQIIHMNGRVYDYNLGRFMSVDPFIVGAGNSQAINPYSYGMNNPLSGTDPTGYVWETGWDIVNVVYDIGKIGYGYSTGNAAMVADGFTDLAADAVAVATPFLPAGSTKLGRVTMEGVEVATDAKKVGNGANKAVKGKGPDIGSVGSKAKTAPDPDGGFTADLGKSKAKTRSGHRNAGNKQIHEKMKNDPEFRSEMEAKHGDDVFDRTSTSGSGRKNPQGTEWDHNSNDANKLDLRTKANHAAKTKTEKKGGFAKFHKAKLTGNVRVSGRVESNRLKKLDKLDK
ncbi:MAG: Ig-like domain-containing protein [Pseudomonadota bacterium]|nr:Ig-like domain-containing protein [Pseudomonadota bacterium]